MIIPPVLLQKYAEYKSIVEATANNAKGTLQNYCDQHGYAFISRIKTIESLAEKIETGRYKKWSDLSDLFACTIIVPTLSHENAVIAFCKSVFSINQMIKRGQMKKDPEVFRFESTRIYARLPKPNGVEIIEKPSIYDILFEVQVKTAFEHAWSVSTHDLVYKASEIDWGRLRLAAQIKATVEQLDTLILTFDEAFKNVSKNKWPAVDDKKKIFDYIEAFKLKGYIPKECLPKDLSRFCDNLYKVLQNKENFNVTNALQIIEKEISKTSNDLFPRSISLLQYFICILFKEEFLVKIDSNCYYHISEEVLQIYPELHKINLRFNYDA